jgi:hypothetical protein
MSKTILTRSEYQTLNWDPGSASNWNPSGVATGLPK